MARIVVLYDPNGRVVPMAPEMARHGIAQAMLDFPESEPRDIYAIARRLAELLLEQVDRS